MDERNDRDPGTEADDLLRRALLEPEASISVALRVGGLAVAERLTVVFHGRRDLGTVQTYVAHGGLGAGSSVTAGDLLRVPVDLDLSDAESRDEAEAAYAEQARTLRDALVAADTVLAVWREPLQDLVDGPIGVDASVSLDVSLPAHRLMPIALVAPERHLTVTVVCQPRTLAEGRPPMGIACAQQDVAEIYPLPDDPERCLGDFIAKAAEHARRTAARLEHQEASVRRFLELNGGDGFAETA